MSDHLVRDPGAELSAATRTRREPTLALNDARVGLFSIAKERSEEFMDALQAELQARGVDAQRFSKATHTKIAAEPVLADIVEHCDVVIGALAD